ncbi:MYXO-CTERM sorting domain-containing protein [Pendulispora albinea]|uniref:MYXO-CTERM sorting domain-containing protein n=1 Tax=Pendulispora albinea TaxID=2741071 RepID=A0ABZ2LKS5_9BACT
MAVADETGGPAVLLRTAQMTVKESAAGKIGKQTGAGVMDTSVAADANGNIFMTWTDSVKPNGQTGVQGAISIAQLTESGLQVTVPPKALPALNGERTHMRPLAAIGDNFLIDIFASEDNGNNNNNPQAVAWVFDKQGNMLNISNTTRGNNKEKPTNLIKLGGGDDQQYGPHSICPLGKDGNGESFLVGVQRNNQNAYVMKVKVEMQNNAAKVTVPYLTKVVNEAQHSRPQVECEPPGVAVKRRTRVITTVEANNQPADIGVRAVLFDVDTGKAVKSKLIAASAPRQNMYAVQPSVAFVSEDVVAIQWQKSANARRTRVKGNGHTGGENLSMLTTLKVSSGGDAFTKLDEASRVAPYQRHAHAIGSLYGGGAGTPAVAVMGGSSSGTGPGRVQMIPVDPVTGKISTLDPYKMYEVSTTSDVANLPARGKRNPQDQGAGFINGIGGLKNPGFGKPNGFMPEVASFTMSAIPGLKDLATATKDSRHSMFLTLVPSTWQEGIKTTPGRATSISDIKNGPSPTVVVPPPPVGQSPDGTDPFGNGPGNDPGNNSGGLGDDGEGGDMNAGAGGCSVGATNTTPAGVGALLAGMLAALTVVRRKRES